MRAVRFCQSSLASVIGVVGSADVDGADIDRRSGCAASSQEVVRSTRLLLPSIKRLRRSPNLEGNGQSLPTCHAFVVADVDEKCAPNAAHTSPLYPQSSALLTFLRENCTETLSSGRSATPCSTSEQHFGLKKSLGHGHLQPRDWRVDRTRRSRLAVRFTQERSDAQSASLQQKATTKEITKGQEVRIESEQSPTSDLYSVAYFIADSVPCPSRRSRPGVGRAVSAGKSKRHQLKRMCGPGWGQFSRLQRAFRVCGSHALSTDDAHLASAATRHLRIDTARGGLICNPMTQQQSIMRRTTQLYLWLRQRVTHMRANEASSLGSTPCCHVPGLTRKSAWEGGG